jgi:hypothetical protein
MWAGLSAYPAPVLGKRERMSSTIVVRTKTCTVCGDYEVWSLDRELVNRWQGGENIQQVFPDMSAEDRELLISGIHPVCWDQLFPKEMQE